MASIARLTNNSDETDIASLISKDNIFSIPFFQRPYKWKPERIKQLQNDILALVDESSDFHFLGAVIVHGRRTNPSDPDVFDVIDGQQRLTTIFLLLCATVKVLSDLGELDEAAAIFQKYIAINRSLTNLSNSRLHSCKEDRAQLNSVIRDILQSDALKEKLPGFKFKSLPIVANTKDKGTLRNNYNSMLRFLRNEQGDGGVVRLRQIYSSLLNKVTIVQIDIKDPASGPTIFDSLNSRQEPMTIGDLVRNGIFSKVADQEPDEIEVIDREHWQPFYQRFEHNNKNYFDSYFFPYGLIINSNLKKSDIYNSLQKKWADISDPSEIISELERYQLPFMDLMTGSNSMQNPEMVRKAFYRLHELGLPSSTLPFLMRLSKSFSENEVSEDSLLKILATVESFLVRRALCGIEPTGLHAVFKGLWQDISGNIDSENVINAIVDHKTVSWPSNSDVSQALRTRDLYNSNITNFFLLEYDRSLVGDNPNIINWVEHILPRNPDPDWWEIVDREKHSEYVNLIGNLLPLSSEMNASLGNKLYDDKKDRYSKDSGFKSARELASNNTEWNYERIKQRSESLADWALVRWSECPRN